MATAPTEADMAVGIVDWLHARGWLVYQEVALGTGGARADIVALRGPLLHVIECKRPFTWGVLDQAWGWRRYANMISVATGYNRTPICSRICTSLGLGWITASGYVGHWDVREEVAPAIRRRVDPELRSCLRPEHLDYAKAGTRGGYFTAWRGTCARLAEFLKDYQHGVVPIRAVKEIQHHYATDKSARDCLVRDARFGKIPGVTLVEDRWGSRFVPASAADATLLATDGPGDASAPASSDHTS